MKIEFKAKLWRWEMGKGSWYFVTLPKNLSKNIKDTFNGIAKGFGSIKVEVVIEKIKFTTSIFPSTEQESYMLPVKAQVRKSLDWQENKFKQIEIGILE